MRKQSWIKRDPIKNYFPLPNEIFSLGLSSTAIAVYGYLLCREGQKTYECLASYRMIGEAIGKSVTTVRKYVCELEGRGRRRRPSCHGDAQHRSRLCRQVDPQHPRQYETVCRGGVAPYFKGWPLFWLLKSGYSLQLSQN